MIREVLQFGPGKPAVIESSTDLRDWIPVSTNLSESTSFQFIDPNPTTDRRFYRAVVPP